LIDRVCRRSAEISGLAKAPTADPADVPIDFADPPKAPSEAEKMPVTRQKGARERPAGRITASGA